MFGKPCPKFPALSSLNSSNVQIIQNRLLEYRRERTSRNESCRDSCCSSDRETGDDLQRTPQDKNSSDEFEEDYEDYGDDDEDDYLKYTKTKGGSSPEPTDANYPLAADINRSPKDEEYLADEQQHLQELDLHELDCYFSYSHYDPPKVPSVSGSGIAPKSVSFFGRSAKDPEWNQFALAFYEWINALNKVVTYWYSIYFGDRASLEMAFELQKTREDCDAFDYGTDCSENPHVSRLACWKMNPLCISNGKHVCYAYWLQIMVCATRQFKIVEDYFLEISTNQHFLRMVMLEGIKNNVDKEYIPSHKTSMRTALCAEMNRLRLLVRSSRLFPVSFSYFDRLKRKEEKLIDQAVESGSLNSCVDKRGAMVTPFKLRSCTGQVDALVSSREKFCQNRSKCRDVESTKSHDSEAAALSSNIEKRARAALVKILKDDPVPPVTCFQEMVGSFLSRHKMSWKIENHAKYSNLILDKLCLYFYSPRTAEIFDDPALRVSVASRKVFQKLTPEDFEPNDSASQDSVERLIGVVKTNACFSINLAFVQYASCVSSELIRDVRKYSSFPNEKWVPSHRCADELDFKLKYMRNMRTFLKLWFRFKMIHRSEILRDAAGERYAECFLTECEIEWGKYRSENLEMNRLASGDAPSNPHHIGKVISTSKTKLTECLRKYEREFINSGAGSTLPKMYEMHRLDPSYRGFSDWLRFTLAGSVFSSGVAKFVTSESPYVLDQDQEIQNPKWFEEKDFPFMWLSGGRYKLFCNKKTWYFRDLPLDLEEEVERMLQMSGSKKKILEQNLCYQPSAEAVSDEWFEGFLRQCAENHRIDSDLDPHFYNFGNRGDLKSMLYDRFSKKKIPIEESPDDRSIPSSNDSWCQDFDVGRPRYDIFERLLARSFDKLRASEQSSTLGSFRNDDGDTLYDTLALWYFMSLETVDSNSPLSMALRKSVVEACRIMLDPNDFKVQSDNALMANKPLILEVAEATEYYERHYIV